MLRSPELLYGVVVSTTMLLTFLKISLRSKRRKGSSPGQVPLSLLRCILEAPILGGCVRIAFVNLYFSVFIFTAIHLVAMGLTSSLGDVALEKGVADLPLIQQGVLILFALLCGCLHPSVAEVVVDWVGHRMLPTPGSVKAPESGTDATAPSGPDSHREENPTPRRGEEKKRRVTEWLSRMLVLVSEWERVAVAETCNELKAATNLAELRLAGKVSKKHTEAEVVLLYEKNAVVQEAPEEVSPSIEGSRKYARLIRVIRDNRIRRVGQFSRLVAELGQEVGPDLRDYTLQQVARSCRLSCECCAHWTERSGGQGVCEEGLARDGDTAVQRPVWRNFWCAAHECRVDGAPSELHKEFIELLDSSPRSSAAT